MVWVFDVLCCLWIFLHILFLSENF
jgi:hypothetical protein